MPSRKPQSYRWPNAESRTIRHPPKSRTVTAYGQPFRSSMTVFCGCGSIANPWFSSVSAGWIRIVDNRSNHSAGVAPDSAKNSAKKFSPVSGFVANRAAAGIPWGGTRTIAPNELPSACGTRTPAKSRATRNAGVSSLV